MRSTLTGSPFRPDVRLRPLADIGWIGHFGSGFWQEVIKHELSNRPSKPDPSDWRVCGPPFYRSGTRLSRQVWRHHRSYPLVKASDDCANVRVPSQTGHWVHEELRWRRA